MNVLCKIFGHRMFYDYDILGPTHCKRWGCNHREKAKPIKWPRPPMPKCKPPGRNDVY